MSSNFSSYDFLSKKKELEFGALHILSNRLKMAPKQKDMASLSKPSSFKPSKFKPRKKRAENHSTTSPPLSRIEKFRDERHKNLYPAILSLGYLPSRNFNWLDLELINFGSNLKQWITNMGWFALLKLKTPHYPESITEFYSSLPKSPTKNKQEEYSIDGIN